MTQQRQPTVTGDHSIRLNVELSRLLCNDAYSASCRSGTGKTQVSRGVVAAGLLPFWMLDRA